MFVGVQWMLQNKDNLSTNQQHSLRSQDISPQVPVHFGSHKEDKLLTKDKKTLLRDFISHTVETIVQHCWDQPPTDR
jgi:hypothetical protein